MAVMDALPCKLHVVWRISQEECVWWAGCADGSTGARTPPDASPPRRCERSTVSRRTPLGVAALPCETHPVRVAYPRGRVHKLNLAMGAAEAAHGPPKQTFCEVGDLLMRNSMVRHRGVSQPSTLLIPALFLVKFTCNIDEVADRQGFVCT
jgi:hypothetical protein